MMNMDFIEKNVELATTIILYEDAIARFKVLLEDDSLLVRDIYLEFLKPKFDIELVRDKIYQREVIMENITSLKHDVERYADELSKAYLTMSKLNKHLRVFIFCIFELSNNSLFGGRNAYNRRCGI